MKEITYRKPSAETGVIGPQTAELTICNGALARSEGPFEILFVCLPKIHGVQFNSSLLDIFIPSTKGSSFRMSDLLQ